MVFKAKYANENARIGDTRGVRHFAWLPYKIKDAWVWLETYETLQYYTLTQYPVIGETNKFIDVYNWIDIADRIILPKVQIQQ